MVVILCKTMFRRFCQARKRIYPTEKYLVGYYYYVIFEISLPFSG